MQSILRRACPSLARVAQLAGSLYFVKNALRGLHRTVRRFTVSHIFLSRQLLQQQKNLTRNNPFITETGLWRAAVSANAEEAKSSNSQTLSSSAANDDAKRPGSGRPRSRPPSAASTVTSPHIAHHPHLLHAHHPFDPLAGLHFGQSASPTTGLFGHHDINGLSPTAHSALRIKREHHSATDASVRPPSSLSLVSTPSPGVKVSVKREPGSESASALSPAMRPNERTLLQSATDAQQPQPQPVDLRGPPKPAKVASPYKPMARAVESSERANDDKPERQASPTRRSTDSQMQCERATQACMSDEEAETLTMISCNSSETESVHNVNGLSITSSSCQVDMDAEDDATLAGRDSRLSLCSDDDIDRPLTINEHDDGESGAPVISAKDAPVIQFVSSHGLEELVDSLENSVEGFAPHDANNKKAVHFASGASSSTGSSSAYDSGLSLLSVLCEQRSMEEKQRHEQEKRRHSTDAALSTSVVDRKITSDSKMPLKKRARSESCPTSEPLSISQYHNSAESTADNDKPVTAGKTSETAKRPLSTVDEGKEPNPAPKKKRKESTSADIDPYSIRRSVRIFIHDSIATANASVAGDAAKKTDGALSSTPGSAKNAKARKKGNAADDKEQRSDAPVNASGHDKVANEQNKMAVDKFDESCRLTNKDLDQADALRIVVRVDDMLYAGAASQINGTSDIYSVTFDGDRSTAAKKQIYSREDLLKCALKEKRAESVDAIPTDTRVCARWSELYRGYYVGTRRCPSPNAPAHERDLVFIEFDDGDKATGT